MNRGQHEFVSCKDRVLGMDIAAKHKPTSLDFALGQLKTEGRQVLNYWRDGKGQWTIKVMAWTWNDLVKNTSDHRYSYAGLNVSTPGVADPRR